MKNINLTSILHLIYKIGVVIALIVLSLQIYDLSANINEINYCYQQIDEYPTLRNIEVMYARIDSIENNLQSR